MTRSTLSTTYVAVAPRDTGRHLRAAWTVLCRVAGWPGRIARARRLLGQLGAMDDHALRDIGLTRQDLRDATAVRPDRDPSVLLKTRAEERRPRPKPRV